MGKASPVKPAVYREDTQEESLAAAQKAARKAARQDVKNHGNPSGGGRGLLDDTESFLPGVTKRHMGAGQPD